MSEFIGPAHNQTFEEYSEQERAKIRAALARMTPVEIEYWVFRLLFSSHMNRDTIQALLSSQPSAPGAA